MVRLAAGDQSIKRHSGRKLQRVAPDRGFGGWGCPGPLALTGVGDQLTGALSRTQSTRNARVFDKNQTSLVPCMARRVGHCRPAFDYAAVFINHQIGDLYPDRDDAAATQTIGSGARLMRGIAHDLGAELAFIKGNPGQIVRLELPQISRSDRVPYAQAAE